MKQGRYATVELYKGEQFEAVWEEVDRLASEAGRSRSAYVNRILERHVNGKRSQGG